MHWMLVAVNKILLRKTLISFGKILAIGYAVSKIESTSWKTSCLYCFHQYYFLWSTWHVKYSPKKFQIGINISHVTFFQCVWIKPHSSSLTNPETLISSFGQSVQISFREKENEENNGNKVFCVNKLFCVCYR